jgi:hypothetical protein
MKAPIYFVLLALVLSCSKEIPQKNIILISANAEWRVVKSVYPNENFQTTPWGEYFEKEIETSKGSGEAYGKPEVFINGTEVVMRKLLSGYLPGVLQNH